jgi:hypothetical protein
MPTLKKSVHYKRRGEKSDKCDAIPLEDREVSLKIFSQFEEIKPENKKYEQHVACKES